jgi:hypothetical protein
MMQGRLLLPLSPPSCRRYCCRCRCHLHTTDAEAAVLQHLQQPFSSCCSFVTRLPAAAFGTAAGGKTNIFPFSDILFSRWIRQHAPEPATRGCAGMVVSPSSKCHTLSVSSRRRTSKPRGSALWRDAADPSVLRQLYSE